MEGLVVLVAFSLAFVGIAVWVYLPVNRHKINAHAAIPFSEDKHGN